MQDESRWIDYIENQIGFVLPESQLRWLNNAIISTAKKYHLTTEELWLQIHDDTDKRSSLLDAVLITESRFFRHKPSIDFVTEQAGLFFKKEIDINAISTNDVFHIWSVGCSEGYEPWSIAMNLRASGYKNFHVLGTDINTNAIDMAKKAVYANSRLANIPQSCLDFVEDINQPLDLVLGIANEQWTIAQQLRSYVSFALHNIFLENDKRLSTFNKIGAEFNIIFCQNMLIYFRRHHQIAILNRLVDKCVLGGHLVLAPNEGYFWQHPRMRRIENEQINAWQRIS